MLIVTCPQNPASSQLTRAQIQGSVKAFLPVIPDGISQVDFVGNLIGSGLAVGVFLYVKTFSPDLSTGIATGVSASERTHLQDL